MTGTFPNTFTAEQSEILRTLLYFDVFRYPLTEAEIFENSSLSVPPEKFSAELSALIDSGFVIRKGDYIMCLGRSNADIAIRQRGNRGASDIMPVAIQYSAKIAAFPFVESVCISGSLSKNYFDEKSDVDFFIITKPGRLWLCRTFLILKYKLLPKRLKKYWCTNYFISSDDLALPDRNAFTATELAFLKPMVNYNGYKELIDQNQWYREKFPNKPLHEPQRYMHVKEGRFKRTTEWILSGAAGTLIDNLLLKITHSHWRKKYSEMSEADFDLQYRSKKNVCKRHTKGFQNKVLKRWQEFQEQFAKTFNASLQ
jgi:hypothetical protein